MEGIFCRRQLDSVKTRVSLIKTTIVRNRVGVCKLDNILKIESGRLSFRYVFVSDLE